MNSVNKLGFWAAVITTSLTIITFIIAIFTPPLSGPYCTIGCYDYPYVDIASRFPRDYYWMYPATLLVISYYILMVAIHYTAPKEKKIFSHVGVSLSLITTAIFVIDYYLQFSVIQPSLLKGESDGISLLSQFNPHGLFIVLEEIGFIMMSLSMLFMATVFMGKTIIEKAIKWIFSGCFILTISSFVFYSIYYDVFREYRFEVAAISINWFTLIISGILLAILFRRKEQSI